ncbi:MAG TPA: hypothetical protein VNH83_09235 [Bryobacteraceae bacterium]|nr:hypothetical protein [Bryobacteraceae bacterium]
MLHSRNLGRALIVMSCLAAASCVPHRGFPLGDGTSDGGSGGKNGTGGIGIPATGTGGSDPGDSGTGGSGTGGDGAGGAGTGGAGTGGMGTGGSGTGGAGTGGVGTGGAGTGGAGTGGAGTGGAGTGGMGTGGAGTGGQAMDAPPEVSMDVPPEAKPDICASYTAGSGSLPNVSTQDFCEKYAVVCTFGGASRYSSQADCFTKYAAATETGRTCRAGHLCNAAAAGAAIHCPHATGLAVCE